MTDETTPRAFHVGDVVKTSHNGEIYRGTVYQVGGPYYEGGPQNLWIDVGHLHILMPASEVELISPALEKVDE